MASHTLREQLTLVELAKRTADGNILQIAEVLEQTNEMQEDAVWVEANGMTSHIITVRTSLPSGTFRILNDGIPAEASSTRQIEEGIGMLESISEVDAKLVDLAPDPGKFRSDEDMAFIEGLSQTLQLKTIYGNRNVTPAEFTGLTNRYNDLALANVHDGAGTGVDVTSIWMIQWGEARVHMIYPRRHKTMGIASDNLGRELVAGQTAGTQFLADRTHFHVDAGLCVRDDRCVQRYANIESAGSTNIFDDSFLIDGLNLMLQRGKGAILYCNRTILSQMDKQANNKTNVQYTVGEEFGRPVTYFRGNAVKLTEQLVNTETAVA